MAMLHARKAKRDDGVRLPAFVLESDNLDSYRPWLKRLRERYDAAAAALHTGH